MTAHTIQRDISAAYRKLKDPVHAWGDVQSMCSMIPGIVAFYPAVAASGNTAGLNFAGAGSGCGQYDEVVTINASGLASWYEFDSPGAKAFYNGDGIPFNITGGEVVYESALRGLSIMAWVYFYDPLNAEEAVVAKWADTTQKSYMLSKSSSDIITASVSGDGSTEITATASAAISGNAWHMIGMSYDPSTSLDVFVDGVVVGQTTTSVPSSLFNSTSELALALDSGDSNGMDGRMAYPLITATYLPDHWFKLYYQMISPLFFV